MANFSTEYGSGLVNDPYYNGLEKFLRERFKDDKRHLQDISDALSHVENLTDISSGRHQRSIADLLSGNQAGELLGLISEYQGGFLKKHPKAHGINFYDPKQSVYIQSIMETVDRACR